MMNNCMISIMPNADTPSASSTSIRQKLKIYAYSTKNKLIIPYSNRLYQTSELMLVYLSIFQLQISQHATGFEITLELPSDDFQGIRRSAEFAENDNHLSSSIAQPKNYLSIYSDTFSRILSDKNYPNFTLHQFRVFGYGPIPKNEITEFSVSFRKCHLLCQ